MRADEFRQLLVVVEGLMRWLVLSVGELDSAEVLGTHSIEVRAALTLEMEIELVCTLQGQEMRLVVVEEGHSDCLCALVEELSVLEIDVADPVLVLVQEKRRLQDEQLQEMLKRVSIELQLAR